MTIRRSLSVFFFLLPCSVFGADSIYCPQHSAFIKVGMSMDEVMTACGKPVSQQESDKPVTKKVPVVELIYNNIGIKEPLGVVGWDLKSGWEGGAQLKVNVIDGKVKSIQMNGGGENASSVCPDGNFQVDDNVGAVYFACGTPSIVNNTFVNQIIPSNEKPKIWVYQTNQFSPPFSLTFIDGKLQSINQ